MKKISQVLAFSAHYLLAVKSIKSRINGGPSRESNRPPSDYESDALPTELWAHETLNWLREQESNLQFPDYEPSVVYVSFPLPRVKIFWFHFNQKVSPCQGGSGL